MALAVQISRNQTAQTLAPEQSSYFERLRGALGTPATIYHVPESSESTASPIIGGLDFSELSVSRRPQSSEIEGRQKSVSEREEVSGAESVAAVSALSAVSGAAPVVAVLAANLNRAEEHDYRPHVSLDQAVAPQIGNDLRRGAMLLSEGMPSVRSVILSNIAEDFDSEVVSSRGLGAAARRIGAIEGLALAA